MKNKGITLIALVITIIVLLILAGITINLTIGNQGVITRAQQASKNYKDAEGKEKEELDRFNDDIDDVLAGIESWDSVNKVNLPKTEGTGLEAVVLQEDGSITKLSKTNDETTKIATTIAINTGSTNWYNYENKQWANAVTKDGSMWVWIPRFAYKITYNDKSDEPDKTQGGTIDIVFLKGTTNLDENGKDVTKDDYVSPDNVTGPFIVHPAFEDGSNTGYPNGEWKKKITGFWISKFESGFAKKDEDDENDEDKIVESNILYTNNATTYYGNVVANETKIAYPVFKPNRPVYNMICAGDAFLIAKEICKAKGEYGLNNIDSHLVKNSEWGAVAYLTDSKYGQDRKIRVNDVSIGDKANNVDAVTGYGAPTENVEEVRNVNKKDALDGVANGNWTSNDGKLASTTGNIYGIYDMNGCTDELVAGYIVVDNYFKYSSGFSGKSDEYQSKYEGTSEDDAENYDNEINKKRIGEALWETTGWNNSGITFIMQVSPFCRRGGGRLNYGISDIYCSGRTYGGPSTDGGFRVVLISE